MSVGKSGRRALWLPVIAGGMAVLVTGAAIAARYEGNADDYSQISQLMTKYSYTLDNHDAQGWASVFTEKGIFRDTNLCLIGRSQIAGYIEKMNARPRRPGADNRPKSRHINENRSIEYIDRNHAIAHSFVMVVGDVGRNHVGGGIEVTGTYDDKLTRVNGRWLIADRHEFSPGDRAPPCPASLKLP